MNEISTKINGFTLRRATVEDAALVLAFMQKLGAYQNMAAQITATVPSLRKLMADGLGEAIFGYQDGLPVGFIFFNRTASAFTGRAGLYIDGFLIDDAQRGRGLGRVMMEFMAQEALARGCQMLEWGCLDWNTGAIEFYKGMGAYCLDIMRIYRMAPEDLARHAAAF